MKKAVIVPLLCVVVLASTLSSCAAKYADAKKLNADYISLMEAFLADLEKATDAKGVAKALNGFSDGMEKLMPRMKKLSEKYPELKDKNNLPTEMAESQKKAEEIGKKMAGAFMKAMPYMTDPEVQKAQQRMMEVMKDK
ncbi:MAG: hypothetical protein QGH15_21205 [Kiritimatiellia bacterium]|jgi:hypothetical protein|nr:hypothetical protein [Kiritimatiellia bacterium]